MNKSIYLILILPVSALFAALFLTKVSGYLFADFDEESPGRPQTKIANFMMGLSGKISIAFSIWFLASCYLLKKVLWPIKIGLPLIYGDANNGFGFVWFFLSNQFLFLSLIGFFWLAIEIYSKQYFLKSSDKRIGSFRILSLSTIVAMVLLVTSQNMLSALLCYHLLMIILCLFSIKFIPIKHQKSARNFSFFILSSAALLFFAVAFHFKIIGNLNFVENGIDLDQVNVWQCSVLLFFYIIPLAFIALAPVYLLFKNLYYLSPITLAAILPSFAFGVLFMLFKVIFYIFGHKFFTSFISNIDHQHLLIMVLGLNLLISGVITVFSKNLKQILTFLFFNQLIFIMIEFFSFGLNARQIQISIVSFILSLLIIFFTIGNINLYLKESGDKVLNGILYKLSITICSLIFALFNLFGLIPAIGIVEKYWLIKSIIIHKSWINGTILLLDLSLLLICIIKLIYPMIEPLDRNQNSKNPENIKDIVGDIELNLGLTLPIIALALILIALPIPFIADFLIKK